MKNVQKHRGFSLVELIVTIAIMAVLVGILSPSLLRYVEKTREGKDTAAIGEFINELYIAASDMNNYFSFSGTLTFEYDASSQCLKTTPNEGANSFSNEVASVVGGDIELVSQKWQSADLIIEVNTTWDTIHVQGNIPDDYEFANCTVTTS